MGFGDLTRRLFGPSRQDGEIGKSGHSGRLSLPFPGKGTRYDEGEFLAVDIETSGLDPDRDEILSIGYVPLVGGSIRLSGAEYHLIRPSRPVTEQSAVIHGLLDNRLENGDPLEAVFARFLAAVRGRVPIAHHAAIESRFLSAACRKIHGKPMEIRYMDTLALEKRRMARQGETITEGALRLSSVRARYGLPRYRAHDALADALAAAELFLVLALNASGKRPATLGDLMT